MVDEFNLIKTYFEPLSTGLADDELGIGDDGAVINTPENHQLVVVMDTLVSGVHFLEQTAPCDIAWKALAVNLSDLAAMGAKPVFFTLGLTLPESDDDWLKSFSSGLAEIANSYNIALVGGDTTKGPLAVTVTAHGWVKSGEAVLRSGARIGDVICVTNSIGSGALGLKLLQGSFAEAFKGEFTVQEKNQLMQALNRPEPQVLVGHLLHQYATSAIDISDGLVADLTHIVDSSNQRFGEISAQVKAEIYLERVPVLSSVKRYLEQTGDWSAVLAGGDDYQLCFTMNKAEFDLIRSNTLRFGVEITEIGRIVERDPSQGLFNKVSLTLNGKPYALNAQGYSHF